MRQTKIVATLSGQRNDKKFISSLFEAGMDVARINTAHVTINECRSLIENVRSVSDKIAILIDTKGPEIRTCKMQEELKVTEGQHISFSHKNDPKNKTDVCVNHSKFVTDLNVGDSILIDDGLVAATVKEKKKGHLICRIENNGSIKNNKSVNVPGVVTHLPALSDKDKRFIKLAAETDIDFIAHSFVRGKSDLLEVQKLLNKYKSEIKIIAKIENLEGVENIDDILENAYGIMVARGDLGIELPPEKIPTVQRNLIRKAIVQKKPVIVATQMLHSMISQPRPTRAEVNDVASAIYSRADAIMLSGETAVGKYPFDSIKIMV
jgi:pyruvate kinase